MSTAARLFGSFGYGNSKAKGRAVVEPAFELYGSVEFARELL